MTTSKWLAANIIGAAFVLAVMETGCTADLWEEVTFAKDGTFECKARNPGFEDLPVFTFDTETADPEFRRGFGTSSTITMTTVDGERVTLSKDSLPGYYCTPISDM